MAAAMFRPAGPFSGAASTHVRSAVVRAQPMPPSQAPPRPQAPPSSSPPTGPSRGPSGGAGGPDPSRRPSTGSGVVAPGQPGPPATPGGFRQNGGPRQSGPAPGRGSYGRGRGGMGSAQGRGPGRGRGPTSGGRGPMQPSGRGPMQGSGRGPMQAGRGRGRGRFNQPEETFDKKVNMEIPYDEVRVLDKSKEMVGVMSLTQAMGMAQAANMDVILINESAQPPLVRICSVSKFKYEIEKVKKEAQKKQRLSQQEIKELKLSPRTEVHDLQVRMRKAHKELSKGNKVKILVGFKGREKESMIPIARNLVDQIFEHVEELATYERRPMIQGRFLACTLMPKESKGALNK